MDHVLRLVAAGLGRLSTRSADRLAAVLAWLWWSVLRLRRGLIRRNVDIAFGDSLTPAERGRIAQASVLSFCRTTLEFFRSRRVDIAADVEVEGGEHLRRALAGGKGVYVLCCHMGNWEAMGAACTRLFAPSYVIVKKVGGERVDRWVTENRLRNGFLVINRTRRGEAFRQINEVLARGEIVGFVMDQARPGEPKLPFFGKDAKTNTSFAAIWRRSPAPIIPGMIRRRSLGRHTLEFFPEVVPTRSGDDEADILRWSAQFNAAVETMVRRCPDQYFWMHNRWKE